MLKSDKVFFFFLIVLHPVYLDSYYCFNKFVFFCLTKCDLSFMPLFDVKPKTTVSQRVFKVWTPHSFLHQPNIFGQK